MALKFKLTKAEYDALDDAKKALYKVGDDGNYRVDVDGAVDKERLDEFRNKNVEMLKRLEDLKDIDPAKYRELSQVARELAEGKLIKEGKIDELVNLRVGEMKKNYDTELANTKKALEASHGTLNSLLIDSAAKDAAIKHGVASTAVADVVLRAKNTFKINEGKAVPLNESGQPVYGKDGTSPMSMDEWVGGLKETSPHLFVKATGTGAQGGKSGNGAAGNGANMSANEKIAAGLKAQANGG